MKTPFTALDDIWVNGVWVRAGSTGLENPALMLTEKQARVYITLGQMEPTIGTVPAPEKDAA